MIPCPLCKAEQAVPLGTTHQRSGARELCSCKHCSLVFVHPKFLLGPSEEKARYLQHKNDIQDSRYRTFLSQVMIPITERVRPEARGLDYGSGPGPALFHMFEEANYRMKRYDPYFDPDTEALTTTYDFITCTETAEHFFYPRIEFEKMWQLLVPGGVLGVLTSRWTDPTRWDEWYYAQDPTHVCFYHDRTMHWIGEWVGGRVTLLSSRVAFFQKPNNGR